jgi:hypothetical protein
LEVHQGLVAGPGQRVACGSLRLIPDHYSGFDSALYRNPEAKWHFSQENATSLGLQMATCKSKPL